MSEGFSTLLVVIIIGTIITGLILYASTAGLWSIQGSIADKISMQSDQMASACAELALEVIRENNSFTGSGSGSIGSNNCNYTVSNTGGSNRQVNVTSVVSGITRKIKIITDSFNPINVVSWQNVGDF